MKHFVSLMLVYFATSTQAWGYIAAMPTLGKIASDAANIAVLEVDTVNRERRVVIFKKVADLKGKDSPGVAKHRLTEGSHPRHARAILDWAEPGQTAVCFRNRETCVTCIGGLWYQSSLTQGEWWTMTTGRPELSYAYFGSATKLRDHVTALVAGRETVISALKYRVFALVPGPGKIVERKWEHWDANEAICAGRLMRGTDWPICRIKASLRMPNTVPELIRDSNLVVGDGPGGPDDVPALIKALQHEDGRVRIDAAHDLGLIGPPAADALTALLKLSARDAIPLVRVEAAKAMASIDRRNETAIPMLVELLKDKSSKVRKRTAECLGDLGARANPAVAALVSTMSDPDPTVSWAAIDALGQGLDAHSAVLPLVEALKDANTRDAAIAALGQIGRKARAAIPALEKIVQGEEAGSRWAAAAALVRIGGAGAKTGVRYLLEAAVRGRERSWTDAENILMAPSSREGFAALLDAVRDPTVRDYAAGIARNTSVYLINDPLPDVKVLLKDRDAGVRCVAAWVLHCARAVEIKEVIAVQRETLKAADPWARRQSVGYLGSLGPAAADAESKARPFHRIPRFHVPPARGASASRLHGRPVPFRRQNSTPNLVHRFRNGR